MLSLAFCVSAQNVKHYTVEQSDYTGVKIHFTAGELAQQPYKYGADTYAMLNMSGFAMDGAIGQPDLPTLVKLVEVPLGGNVTYKITAATYDTIEGALLGITNLVMPHQPSRSKSDRSAFVLQKDNQAYTSDVFFGSNTIRVQNIGVARDRNLAEIYFSPLRYNPVSGKFIVCRSLDVTVMVQNADITATQQMKARYHSGAYNMTADVINSLSMPKDVRTAAPLRYLIVSHTMFQGQLDSFIQWKRRQGLMVDVAYTNGSVMSDNSSLSVKNYIKQQYTNATDAKPAPTYVLLVGDVEQIPAANTYSGSDSYISDLEYFTWTDGDNLPDCYYGRFSAQNVAQLTPQIEKTLMYEQYSFPNDEFLGRAALIAGEDGGYSSDNAYKYADPAMDYIAKMYVTSNNGFNSIVYYKNNTSTHPTGVTVTGSCSNSSVPSALCSYYNNGFGWVNYSAHGDVDQWYKPSFTTSSVSAMTNQYKFGVMIGNCCLTNHFQTTTCLGEALLRKSSYEGAVGYIGASTYSYWYEDFAWAVGMRSETAVSNSYDAPYDAQNLGMYDRLFHSHGEAFNQWHTTLGSMVTAGNLAVQASTSSLKLYYWQIYHLMGDPSLMPWLGQAEEMSINQTTPLLPGSSTYSVTTPAYAYVALTHGDSLMAATFADANGNATLSLPNIAAIDSVELAVTAQNYKPFFRMLPVVSPSGPYIVVDSLTCNNLTANDTASFNIYLSNIGVSTAENISITMSVNGNNLLLLTPRTTNLNTNIAAGATTSRNNIARAFVWPTTANGTRTQIAVSVIWSDGTNTDTCTYSISPAVKAPLLSAAISGSNKISAGSTVTLTVNNLNSGSVALGNATGTLTSSTGDVVVSNASAGISGLAAGASATTQYTLTVSNNLPANCSIPLNYVISNGTFSYHTTLNVLMGSNTEDFETHNFTKVAWQQDNSHPWTIDSTTVHGGRYSARSYKYSTDNGNSTNSRLTLQWTSMADDSISFWYKVSSESGYDFFQFYMDGASLESGSGNGSWKRVAFPVTAGSHTFVFSYEKDYSSSDNSDCTWLDDISLPKASTYRFLFDTVCAGSNYTVADTTINTSGFTTGNHSVSFAKNGLTYNVDLTVNAIPVVTITASPNAQEYSTGSHIMLTAGGAERYVWTTGEKVPQIAVEPKINTTYIVNGYNGSCSASARTRINIAGDTTVSINNVEGNKLLLYPNPTDNRLNISSDANIRSLQVYNIQGQLVKSATINADNGSVELSQLPQGVYMMQIILSDGTTRTQKVIKK
jgi:hypothetical protein